MQPFTYQRETGLEAASAGAREKPATQFIIADASTLTDYMTLDVMQPPTPVGIDHLPARYAQIDSSDTRLRLGALVRVGQAEEHPAVRARYPVVQQTLALAASRPTRNMVTLGGNVLQRTRCEYFHGQAMACNKHVPGSGCAALDGLNRAHAVLGTSESCIATYEGDFAQALIALDAIIETAGSPFGPRRIPFARLHRLPEQTPQAETALTPGEMITYIDVPAGAWTRRSRYVKVCDPESYQWALASAAVAMQLEGNVVREARIALGGVATVPWRAREAEAVLNGHRMDEALAVRAAEAAFADARPRRHNSFKIPLGKRTLVRALLETAAMSVAHE